MQSNVLVAWSATDPSPGSGLDTSKCLLEVREDEGTWQAFSTDCGGDDTYDGQPGHTYTFRLSASDNVSNAASLEVEAVVPYVTKYYYANGQRVAMQREGVVYYVHTDHLGSVSLVTDHVSEAVARQLYHPYGTVRHAEGTLPTDYTFTGQRDEAGLGLMHYGARFYSPRLGRFVSADTIVPQPGEPQALNRYAYVGNNPLRYTDPSGHRLFEDDPGRPYFRPSRGSIYGRRTPTWRPRPTPTPQPTPTLPSGPATPQATGTPTPTTKHYNFTAEQWGAVETWSGHFDLPEEFTSAVVAAEVLYDTDPYDRPVDRVIGHIAVLGILESWWAEAFLERSQSGLPLLGGRTFGPGIGQVHAATAMQAEQHFGEDFPIQPETASMRHMLLVLDETNIMYVAAILRMYADQRPGSRDASGQMTVDEMGAVFANFHEDVRTAFGSQTAYEEGAPPTASGQRWGDQLRPLIWYYRAHGR